MWLAAGAITSPITARAKLSQFGRSAIAAASRPPMSPEVAVIEKTAARVMISQRLIGSIVFPAERLAVSITSFQLARRDIPTLLRGKIGADPANGQDNVQAVNGNRRFRASSSDPPPDDLG